MPFKLSFQYQQQTVKLGGWTENFWCGLSDLTAATAKAGQLRTLLDPLHGNTTFLTGCRISDAATFRDVTLLSWPLNTQNPGTSPGSVSDYPTNALLLRLTGLPNYRTQQWLKGIWDGVIASGGYYQPTATYQGYMQAFLAFLTAGSNSMVLRVLDKSQAFKPIKDITQAGVVNCTGHGYSDNAMVRISRCRGLTQANNVWRITRIDADTFSLQGWVAPSPATPYLGNGVSRLRLYTYVPIGGGSIIRATEHAVGRPLEQLIGRRRTRRT